MIRYRRCLPKFVTSQQVKKFVNGTMHVRSIVMHVRPLCDVQGFQCQEGLKFQDFQGPKSHFSRTKRSVFKQINNALGYKTLQYNVPNYSSFFTDS